MRFLTVDNVDGVVDEGGGGPGFTSLLFTTHITSNHNKGLVLFAGTRDGHLYW
jgi:hypothetical protein